MSLKGCPAFPGLMQALILTKPELKAAPPLTLSFYYENLVP